jgi:UPF0755 protein
VSSPFDQEQIVVPDDQPEGYGAPQHLAARRRGRGGRRLLTIVAILVVLLVALVGGGLLWAQGQINPGGHRGPLVAVTIPKGSSSSEIGKILAKAGVIHNATLFEFYVKLHGDNNMLPGHYSLPKNSTYDMAISALKAGPKIITENLVIPEGFTVRQIANAVQALPNMGLSAQAFIAAADSGTVRSPYEPSGVNNLEGLLFPATYPVSQGETEVNILEQMIGAFNDRAAAVGLQAAATALHESPYQVITVASIIEREAKLNPDRSPVASVIYNRLRAGTPLGADSTQTYYLRISDPTLVPSAAQLDQPSPYNTRLNKGLPPTPIANPGLPSLEAATAPTSTTYLYFVEINPDGKLGFASTDAGFTSLQDQCRAAKLC